MLGRVLTIVLMGCEGSFWSILHNANVFSHHVELSTPSILFLHLVDECRLTWTYQSLWMEGWVTGCRCASSILHDVEWRQARMSVVSFTTVSFG